MRWSWVFTLSDVVYPLARILEGNYFPLLESEHGGKQVMFGIGRMIMMLDLRVNSPFGKKFVRTTEVVVAWDMLLRESISQNVHASLRKHTLGIVFRELGVVDPSGMATPL